MLPQKIYLKTVFNIPFNSNSKDDIDLLIELSNNGIILYWTSDQSKKSEGYAVYVFEENDNHKTTIEEIFKSINASNNKYTSVKVCYNYKESILVPEKHHDSNLNNEMLSLIYGEDFSSVQNSEFVNTKAIHNIYRVPAHHKTSIENCFNNYSSVHSTSLQIKNEVDGDIINCIVYQEIIKVLVYKKSHLQLVQQYQYTGPNDVAYHVLNICKQFELNPSSTPLRLSGMIVKDSQLYQSLYNCFLDIDFLAPSNQIKIADQLSHLPNHFFSHLTELVSCEL